MVKNYPELTLAVFVSLNHEPAIADYYEALSKLKLSKRVKKFVFALRKQVELPTVYIQMFIANQIETLMTAYEFVITAEYER